MKRQGRCSGIFGSLLVMFATLPAAAAGKAGVSLEATPVSPPPVDRNALVRTLVTTDGEADDMNSFMRLLYYANELDIAGLVYSSSVHHWKGDGVRTLAQARKDGLITSYKGETAGSSARSDDALSWRWEPAVWMERMILDDYSAIYPNLLKHDPNYPSPAELWSKVAMGNVTWESDFSEDTPGSDLIKAAILDADSRPLYLQAWGGTGTIARALLAIEKQYRSTPEWSAIESKVSRKAVILAIGQQDTAYADYIAKAWPRIRLLDFGSVFGGFSSFSRREVPDEILSYYKAGFWAANIKYGHGPLLARYGLIGDGTYFAGEGDNPGWQPGQARDVSTFRMFGMIGGYERLDWTGEGDSPAFMSLVPTGLRFLQDPSLGSWGGRLVRVAQAGDSHAGGRDINPKTRAPSGAYTVIRWMPAIGNDFAARANWGITDRYGAANHPPRVFVVGAPDVYAAAGQSVTLALQATDPDGDKLATTWWIYGEASTVTGNAVLAVSRKRNQATATLVVPASARPGERMVVVASVTDAGVPALTRYAQYVVTVR